MGVLAPFWGIVGDKYGRRNVSYFLSTSMEVMLKIVKYPIIIHNSYFIGNKCILIMYIR